MFSGPMLIILFIQLLSFLSLASSSLIQVKRMELKQKKKQEAANTASNTDTNDNDTDINTSNSNSKSNINANTNDGKEALLKSNENEKTIKRRTTKGKK